MKERNWLLDSWMPSGLAGMLGGAQTRASIASPPNSPLPSQPEAPSGFRGATHCD